jgi:hypothetical protein
VLTHRRSATEVDRATPKQNRTLGSRGGLTERRSRSPRPSRGRTLSNNGGATVIHAWKYMLAWKGDTERKRRGWRKSGSRKERTQQNERERERERRSRHCKTPQLTTSTLHYTPLPTMKQRFLLPNPKQKNRSTTSQVISGRSRNVRGYPSEAIHPTSCGRFSPLQSRQFHASH